MASNTTEKVDVNDYSFTHFAAIVLLCNVGLFDSLSEWVIGSAVVCRFDLSCQRTTEPSSILC